MADLLSALDASFLFLESPRTPMHVGSLSLFEGDALRDEAGRIRLDELRASVDERLALVPRFRKRVLVPPLRLGLPRWIDAEAFDVAHHVKVVTLPPPGSIDQLRTLASELHMELLDRSRPLWEMWFVDGLEDGRVAVVEKIHHALVDGVSGVDVATATMDLTRETRHVTPEQWIPEHMPSLLRVLSDAAVTASVAPPRAFARRVVHPMSVIRAARTIARGLSAAPLSSLRAPRTSLNQTIGSTRLLEAVTLSLDDAKAIGRVADTKANDVLLAAVAGGLRALLTSRGDSTDVRPQALVPVSLRSDGERLGLGNRVSALVVPLPVDLEDPMAQLAAIKEATAVRKERGQANVSAAAFAALDAVPPLLWSPITALVHHQPLVNVVVTNVPGSPVPLYMLGSQLIEAVPIVPLAANLDVSIGILSYQSDVVFGLYADASTCADVGVLAEGIEKTFIEMRGRCP